MVKTLNQQTLIRLVNVFETLLKWTLGIKSLEKPTAENLKTYFGHLFKEEIHQSWLFWFHVTLEYISGYAKIGDLSRLPLL